jgi:predicted dehydrogenase
MNRVKVTMIGLGQWGPNLLRNLRDNADAEIVGLCDANAKRLDEFRALHPGATLTTSITEALAISSDAVVLATPAGLHEAHVRTCLDAGRDVLVEKPLALSLGAARALAEHAESRGRILMTGHTFLYNNVVRPRG